MRLIITLLLVLGSIYAGWHFYPELFKAISGKEPVLKAVEEAAPAATDAPPATAEKTSEESPS